MAETKTIKALELRIVNLENQLKALQPSAFGPISDDDLAVYWNLIRKWKPPKPCINECVCGPCMCDPVLVGKSLIAQARLAQLAGVLTKDAVTKLTAQVNEAIEIGG